MDMCHVSQIGHDVRYVKRQVVTGTILKTELTQLSGIEYFNLGCESLSRLEKLETLYLTQEKYNRENKFNKSIILCLSSLISLKKLSLQGNNMGDPFPAPGMSIFMRTPICFSAELTVLKNLETLDLSFNELSSLTMKGLISFCHLELDLSRNNFFASLCKLKKLEELDLSLNLFEGVLPPCLSNMRSLKFFDISLNQFIGNISPSLFESLNSLEYIGLSYNRFEGLFSFRSFANHSNLEVVELISDDENFEVETEFTDWIPMFQLEVLVLSNCNLNKLSGDVLKFLLYQNKLIVVDLSHNNLTSPFPNWLLVNNTRLEYLFLRNNSFVNLFFPPQYCYISTYGIDVSDNHLSGQIQATIGDINAFEGGISSSFGKMSRLSVLDLSTNNFSGEVPNQLVRNCRSLWILKLSNNNFRGQIFSVDFNLTWICTLQLNDNQFTGPLTNVLSKLPDLYFLDISNNYMSGKIPN
ncbi:hypothetical protein HYC85_028591 [Camellia sinensis]|uniref:Uncharacterized protein n=1 Tax=Camellia sinensis TaxID=4442 RepID=A0A7J7FVJ9_CAMSI|nr:hypothetical protein HYC85_028591 [Camellia sinensis]